MPAVWICSADGIASHRRASLHRLRISPTFKSVPLLQKKLSKEETVQTLPTAFEPTIESSELIRIRDIATVERGYLDPPMTLMRYNGQPAIGISITNVAGVNMVKVGK